VVPKLEDLWLQGGHEVLKKIFLSFLLGLWNSEEKKKTT
jgi:hypothetical protein